jgi:phosphatidylserine synthase
MGHSARAIYSVAVDQQVGHASFGLDGPPAWQVDTAVLLLACAAALFVVAGVIRLARWRLAGDQHSALVGSALVVMGGLYLPLVGVAAVGGALQHREFADAVIRALVSFIAVGLVLRALYATTMRSLDRPSRLLPALAATILCTFGVLVAVEASMEDPLPYGPWLA